MNFTCTESGRAEIGCRGRRARSVAEEYLNVLRRRRDEVPTQLCADIGAR
jgi:hypothetical protein